MSAQSPASAPAASSRQCVVVKVGTSSILRGDTGRLALSTLASLVETLSTLRASGCEVVLVSSGAVGVGCQRMGYTERPKKLAELQAMAAIGQPHLMRYYDELFSALGQPIAQVLLSADALDSKQGVQAARATFQELLRIGVIPVVNENDSVAVSELRFGDNDSLSALVAILVGATHLFLATDVDALYTSNPNVPPAPGMPPASAIREVSNITEALQAVETAAGGGGSGTQWGTGGIATKLKAALLASAAGITTVIISAQKPEHIALATKGSREIGTTVLPAPKVVASHKRWIMALPVRGTISLDAGAARALRSGSSLFAAGVRTVDGVAGTFGEREAVRVLDENNADLARALVNYASQHVSLLAGHNSSDIQEKLGFPGPEEIASRRNIVLLNSLDDDSTHRGTEYDGPRSSNEEELH